MNDNKLINENLFMNLGLSRDQVGAKSGLSRDQVGTKSALSRHQVGSNIAVRWQQAISEGPLNHPSSTQQVPRKLIINENISISIGQTWDKFNEIVLSLSQVVFLKVIFLWERFSLSAETLVEAE
jgi:hypothetical protein